MWWCISIIPATWEAEVGGPQFDISQGKMLIRSYLKNKLGVVDHTCNPSYVGGRDRRIMVQGWPWAKVQDPI
jgi:hypothetical protein